MPGPANGPNVPMLLASAVTQLDKQPSISARVRQQVQLLGHQIVGAGSYEQTGPPEQRRFRLELKVPVGDGTGSFERIQTGKELWISEDMPDRSSLTQIDVARVREALAYARGHWQRGGPTPPIAMPLDGLPKLVANLNDAVAFTSVRQGNLDQLAVWQLEGTWKPAVLAQWASDQRDKILAGEAVNWNALPAQLPDRVVLTLGHDDLFPYRIEYFRQPPPSKDYPSGSASTLLATLEFFEVRFGGTIPHQRFVYQPGNRPFTVGTDDYLKQLGIVDLPPPTPSPQSQLPQATPQR